MSKKQILTKKQAQSLFGVSGPTVYLWREKPPRGRDPIPFVEAKGDAPAGYPAADVMKWAKKFAVPVVRDLDKVINDSTLYKQKTGPKAHQPSPAAKKTKASPSVRVLARPENDAKPAKPKKVATKTTTERTKAEMSRAKAKGAGRVPKPSQSKATKPAPAGEPALA